MIRLKGLLVAYVMTIVVANADNKHIEYKQTYNYKKGIELFNNQDFQGAIDYMKMEVSIHQDNGYAYYWIAKNYASLSNFSESLTYAEKSIRYLAKDNLWLSRAYTLRGNVYYNLGETVKAEKDFTQAIAIDCISTTPYEERAEFYTSIGKVELANNDYKRMLEINPAKTEAYVGLAKNAIMEMHFNDVVNYCNKAMKFDSENLEIRRLRADAYTGLGKYDKAVPELLYVVERDIPSMSGKTNACLIDSAFNIVNLHLKAKMRTEPDNAFWFFYAAYLYDAIGNYEDAVIHLGKLYDIIQFDFYHKVVAECYEKMRNFRVALKETNMAIEQDPRDIDLYLRKIDIYTEMGNKELAIANCDSLIRENPEIDTLYYVKGWTCLDFGMMDEAFENIEILYANLYNETWVKYLYGRMLNERRRTSEAKAIFEDIIGTENQQNRKNEKYLMYTYVMLGNYDEAIDLLNKMLDADKQSNSLFNNIRGTGLKDNAYEAACAYALMGNKGKSMEYLKVSMDNGYNKFHHIRNDIDLKAIQGTPEFEALVSEYEGKWTSRISNNQSDVENNYDL